MITGTLSHKGKVILSSVQKTENVFERMRGLLGRPKVMADKGFLIDPCNSVHSFFMNYSLDILYLNSSFEIIKIYQNLQPWQVSYGYGAAMVLELSSGMSKKLRLKEGYQIIWNE